MFIRQLNCERKKRYSFEKINSILRYMIKEKKRRRVIKKEEEKKMEKREEKMEWRIKERKGRRRKKIKIFFIFLFFHFKKNIGNKNIKLYPLPIV